MSIDEAIEDLKECDCCHVAEWLEELKFLRTTKETMYREIYNQALEDIFNIAKQNAYDDGVDYSIGLRKLDELIANISK